MIAPCNVGLGAVGLSFRIIGPCWRVLLIGSLMPVNWSCIEQNDDESSYLILWPPDIGD